MVRVEVVKTKPMKLKLKSKSLRAIELESFKMTAEGWTVIKHPYKRFWSDLWTVKLKK